MTIAKQNAPRPLTPLGHFVGWFSLQNQITNLKLESEDSERVEQVFLEKRFPGKLFESSQKGFVASGIVCELFAKQSPLSGGAHESRRQ